MATDMDDAGSFRIFAREMFYERLLSLNIDAVDAEMVSMGMTDAQRVKKATMYSWKSHAAGLPDIWEADAIAMAADCSPAWLAFSHGPRDWIAAAKAFELAESFESVPGLAHVADAYSRATTDDQKMMQQMARRFAPAPQITHPSDASPVGALLSHAPVPLSKSQAERALVGLKDHMATLLVESKEYAACKDAGILLSRLIDLLPAKQKEDLQLAVFSKTPEEPPTLFQ